MKDESSNFTPIDNKVIERNIEYYIGLSETPGYALFINGPWGSGKTHLITSYLKKINFKNFIHISLYGLSSQQEIEEQFFKSRHPLMSSSILSSIGNLGKTAVKVFGWNINGWADDAQIKIKDFLPDTTNKILIFDDLERCLAVPEALGFINRFIEHYGNKVIVLGDESKIDSQLFKDQKEKTIGRTLTVTPAFKDTFDSVVENLSNTKIKKALVDNYHIINSCFERLSCKNLRTLKFSIMEFSRFFDQFPEEAKDHQEFLQVAIDTFFSICLELRSGNLGVKQISELPSAYSIKSWSTRDKDTEEESPLNKIRKRHFGDKLIIEPDLNLLQVFFEFGIVEKTLMEESIGNSSFFYKDSSPDWVKLWHTYSLTETDFKQYLDSTIKDFKEYKFLDVSTLRHIIGILLDYSEKALIPDLDKNGAIKLCSQVLKHIEDNNLIEIPDKEKDFPSSFEDEYASGLGFHASKDVDFIKLSSQIKEMAKKKKNESYIELVKKVPEQIKNNTDELWSILTSGRQNWEKYPPLYRHPVLQYVDVDDFLKALIEMNPANTARFSVMSILKTRYEHPSKELINDLPWLKNLQKRIEEKIPSMAQPTKYQFEALKGNLDSIISNMEKWSKQKESNDA